MVLPVQETAMDDHAVDYWARQIRIGAWIAVLVTSIGGLRIGLNWPAGRALVAGPVAGRSSLQAAARPVAVGQTGPRGTPYANGFCCGGWASCRSWCCSA